MEHEVKNCNQLHYVQSNNTSHDGFTKLGFIIYKFGGHRLPFKGGGNVGGGTVAPQAADMLKLS